MSGLKSKRKGSRVELEALKKFQAVGQGYKQPLSGALPDKQFKNDLKVRIKDFLLSVEVKARKKFSDYPLIEKCAEDCPQSNVPCLVKKADRKKFLITLFLDDFLLMMRKLI